MTPIVQATCAQCVTRLRAAADRAGRDLAFMEVCGTHTVNAFRSGLHSLMPAKVKLLSGPGCPVCVTSQGDIDQLIELARRDNLTLCTYGDMIRVTGCDGSLEVARSDGADVRVVYSAMDAVKLAQRNPQRQVAFAAVGFETTAPATAAAVVAAERLGLINFTALTSHKLILPAMRALLDAGMARLDGFLCPGHVSVILGAEAFREIVRDYKLPCVIAGFEDEQIATALARLTELAGDGKAELENQYPEAVTAEGNPVAQGLLHSVFEPATVTWRALGAIPGSGLVLRSRYARFDARIRFALQTRESPEPKGCRCAEVITGRCTPEECALFGAVCTPVVPIGPCMVSSEGACQAWFKYHRGATRRPRVESPAHRKEVASV